MATDLFNAEDIGQIQSMGMSVEEVLGQLESFKSGPSYLRLVRPCTLGDGITLLHTRDLKRLGAVYSEAVLSGRAMKFVPASGAASRMVRLLLSFYNRSAKLDLDKIREEADKGDPEHGAFLKCMMMMESFAFYDDLKSMLSEAGQDLETLRSQGRYRLVLEYLLTSKGLNLSNLPKGLIAFHRYPDHTRTAFEEQMAEAAGYVRDRTGNIAIHFTVSREHEKAIREHIERVRHGYERAGAAYSISFSDQKASTSTIAVDMKNSPLRDPRGRLVFRPGGHGALLQNLSDLQGDIVFIKNVDNVVPDRLKETTFIYKRALGGYLCELQERIFTYLRGLMSRNGDRQRIDEIFEFLKGELSVIPPEEVMLESGSKRRDYLITQLNRPLRICGMVRNEGEPGGGPFWVEQAGKGVSIQIVESSQVDMKCAQQKSLWESSTHFNPVDLVCGVRDYLGRPFPLMLYRDSNTWLISKKSRRGRPLKALELPGLWNGSMAHWNTVFVEVPIITFNPVKTVLDLLRPEHMPS